MTKYDFTFLLSEEANSKQLKELIASLSGKISKEETWGGKTLAYPIKKISEAFYYNWNLDIDAAKISELKKKLNLDEKVIRYLLLKVK